jgi:parallel beta-helix repeat protein
MFSPLTVKRTRNPAHLHTECSASIERAASPAPVGRSFHLRSTFSQAFASSSASWIARSHRCRGRLPAGAAPRRRNANTICRAVFHIPLLFFLAVAAIPGHRPAEATSALTYYVAPDGNDSAPGTQSLPWRSIQKGASSVGPGSTVIVLPGDYPERVQVTRSGASGAPITFRAQGAVTMRGFTVDADYVALVGFDISNTPNDWDDGWGIFLQGSYCLIEDNYVHYATRGGISIWASPGNYANTSHCVVRNNRLYRNAMAGIALYGRDNLVEGNEIWGTIQYHPKWINPPDYVDADGMRFFGSGHTIRGNYIHDISLQDPENVNPHIDCFQTWSDASSEAGHDIVFEQNRCVNPNQGMYAFMLKDAHNLTIRNNIIQAFGGVNTGAGANDHLTIVNNVFASDFSFSGGSGIGLGDCPHSTVENNIFYDIPGRAISVDSASAQGLAIGYNSAYHSDGTTPAGSPYANDLWNVDPLFVDPAAADFHLRPGSPLIDAGDNLGSVTNDFDDIPRPQGAGYDIGAFEYLTASSPIPADINQDGHIDVLDVQLCVNVFLGAQTNPGIIGRADVNGDGAVNVLDVQAIVNTYLAG